MEPVPSPHPEPQSDMSEMPTPAHAPGDVFAPGQAAPIKPQPAVNFPPVAPASPVNLYPNPPELKTEPISPPPPTNLPLPPAAAFTSSGWNTGGQINLVQPLNLDSKPPKKRFGLPKNPWLITGAVVLVLLIAGAGAYFGYYVPNKPENVWKSALTNTGKGYDKLTQYTMDQLKSSGSGIKINGNFKTSGVLASDGTFTGNMSGGNGEFTASLSASGMKVNLDTRLIKSATSTPDIYFKVDGIQGLGSLLGGADPQYTNALNSLNDNWYFIDHTFFEQYAQSSSGTLQITAADVNSLLKAVGDASKQYLLTTNPQKAALSLKQIVGAEKQDGRSVYHYKVGVNKANFKAYNNQLCDNLNNNKIISLIGGGESKDQFMKDCKDTSDIDKWDSSATADVWVDRRTKLIHKIRFTDKNNKSNYWDIGQDYQGGSRFPFSLDYHSKDSGDATDSSLNLVLDTKANTLSVNGSTKEGSGSDGFNGSVNFTVGFNSPKVNVQKPANAKNLIQLLNDLGFGDVYSETQTTAKDTERKTDINALEGQIEAYWAVNGYYPTLAELNNASWRSQNLQGLDDAALQDPEGSSKQLASAPATHVYSYKPTPSGCDDLKVQCQDYTLTATLSDGSLYSKQSLNSDSSSLPINVN